MSERLSTELFLSDPEFAKTEMDRVAAQLELAGSLGMVLDDVVQDLRDLSTLIDASKAEGRILGDVCNGAFHLNLAFREDMEPIFDQARDFVWRVSTGDEFRNRGF